MTNLTFKAAGTTFGDRQIRLAEAARAGVSRVELVRDANNKFDANAIKVVAVVGPKDERADVGFVPRDLAAEMAPVVDAGVAVEIKRAQIYGGGFGKNYGISLTVEISAPMTGDGAARARRERAAFELEHLNEWALVNGY